VLGLMTVLGGACGRFGFEEPPGIGGSAGLDDAQLGDTSLGDANIDDAESPADASSPTMFADASSPTMPADAAPGTVLPSTLADTYLNGIDATPNGGDPDVRCGRNSGSGSNLWALWWFDLNGLPTQPVTSATLRVYQYESVGTLALGFEIYRVTQAWDEASADWNNASSTTSWPSGGAIATTIYATRTVQLGALGYYDWDITTLVNEWLTGAFPNYGLQMRYVAQPPTGNYAVFASKEHATVAWRPQLLITP
jgi:hypothetical protein